MIYSVKFYVRHDCNDGRPSKVLSLVEDQVVITKSRKELNNYLYVLSGRAADYNYQEGEWKIGNKTFQWKESHFESYIEVIKVKTKVADIRNRTFYDDSTGAEHSNQYEAWKKNPQVANKKKKFCQFQDTIK